MNKDMENKVREYAEAQGGKSDLVDAMVAYIDDNLTYYNVDDEDELWSIWRDLQDNYIGLYPSGADFAEEYVTENSIIPDVIEGCIDWELVWDKTLRHDFLEYEVPGGVIIIHAF